jgi:Ca2+-binding EF-hand superfamily protein
MAESPPDGAPAAGAPAKAEAAAAGDAAPAPPELTAEERRRQAIAERQRKHDEAALEKQQKAQANSDKRTAAYAKAYNKLCEKGQGTLTASVAENYFGKQAKKEKGNHGVTWQVEDIFRRVNVSNRMDVTLKEFVGLIKAIKKEKRSITRCYNEFEIMDNDSSGEITIREAAEHILQVSSEDGAQIDEETEAQITKYMTKFDKDGDGLMAFPEFWAFTRAQALIKAGVLTDIDDHDKPKDEDLTAAAVVKEPTLPQAPPMSGAKKTMYQNLVDDNGGARREDPKPAPTPVIAARDEANQAHVRTEIKRKRYKSAPPAIREIFDAYAPNTTSRGGGGAGTAASAAVDDDIDAGRLGPQELLELAQAVHFWAGADSHGERPQAEQCAALLAALDADGNGDVSPDEFAAWFMAGAKETELLKNMQDESERIAADPDASAARAAMMDFHDVKKEREEYPSFEKNFRYHLQLQSQEMLLESVHKLHTDALSRSASTEVGQDELLGWMKQVQEATGDQRVPNESDAAAVMKLMAEESGDGLEIIAKDHLVIWAPEVLLHSPMLIPGSEVRQAYLNAADNDTDSGSGGNNDRGTERLRREKVLAFLDGVNLEAGPGTRKRAEELRDMYRAERSQNWQSIGASGDGKVARRQLWEHEREYHENRPSSLHYIYDTFDDSIEAMAERQNNITAGSNIRNTTGFNMKRGHLGGKALFNLANCLYFRAERRREASSGESFLKRRSSTENDSFKHGGKKGNGKLVPTPALATQLISILDKDGNKTIEWAEFKGFLVQGAKMTAADRANLNVQSSARKFSLELLDNVLDENHELMETALRLQYEEFDADISGTMDASELLGWMQEVHLETGARCCEPTPEIAAKVISFLDKDKSGTIEAEEWLEWLREGQLILLDPKRKEQYRRDGGMGAVTILDFLDMVVLRAAKRTRGLLRDIQQDYAEKMAAATKIQAKARGRLQNSEFAEMQAEYQRNSAATKIQSVHRGRQSRRLGGSKGVGAGFGAGTGEPQNEQLIPSARAKLTESEYNKARQEMKDDEPPKTIAPKTIAPKAALPRKPAKKPAPAELLTIEIQEGSIGITFDHDLTVKGIRAGSQANSFKELSRGDFLIKVNNTSVDGQTLRDLKPIIKATPRPMTLVFERHRVWERGPNGLPKIDYGMLYALFEHYEDPDKPGFLDADQFAELISEIHRMAVEHQGRQPHDDIDEVNVPLAQMLIDAHDDNDDQ